MPRNVNKPSIAQHSTARCAKGRERERERDSETELCGALRQARAATRATGVDEIKELCISSGAHTLTHPHTDRQTDRIEQTP